MSPATQQELDQQANNTQKTLDLLDLYVDAKDSVNNWCVARIIDHKLQAGRITIHFDGWSPRYDEVSIPPKTFNFTVSFLGGSNHLIEDSRISQVHRRLHRADEGRAQGSRLKLRPLGDAHQPYAKDSRERVLVLRKPP